MSACIATSRYVASEVKRFGDLQLARMATSRYEAVEVENLQSARIAIKLQRCWRLKTCRMVSYYSHEWG